MLDTKEIFLSATHPDMILKVMNWMKRMQMNTQILRLATRIHLAKFPYKVNFLTSIIISGTKGLIIYNFIVLKQIFYAL